MQNKISALVITLNEEKNIRELMENLAFADEIIVVDSYSTDKTMEILKEFPDVKVYQHPFDNFSAQRNIALSYASNDWILFIDADERLSEPLKNEILETLKKPAYEAYNIKRTFYFFNKPMRFSGLQTDKNVRLFKKNGIKYHGLVHEKLNITYKIGILKNHLKHYSYSDYEHFKNKIFHYNQLKAVEKLQNGKTPSLFMSVAHPLYNFLYRYIWRLGILDGKKGFIVCKVYAQGIQERYQEMKKIKNKKQ